MAGQITASVVQLGDSGTATQNFVVRVPAVPDGTMRIARGNAGSESADIMTVSSAGAAGFSDGTVGAPGVSFSSDTDSGIYRIGANNIGIGVNGAKVLDVSTTGLGVTGVINVNTGNLVTDSNGILTLNKTLFGTYQWNSWNPSDLAGSLTSAGASGTAYTDTNRVSFSNTSGTVTATLKKAGNYLVVLVYGCVHGNSYTGGNMQWAFGGTATNLLNSTQMRNGLVVNGSEDNMFTVAYYVSATANQTTTANPYGSLSASGGTTAQHTFSAIMHAIYLGG